MTGPTLPSLGPFGASARVPPPATGSYGNATSNTNFSNGANYAPAGYAPNPVRPMGFDQSADAVNSGQIANAGGQWVETATQDNFAGSPQNNDPGSPQNGLAGPDLSSTHSRIRAGGMQVIDLTGGPNPPGYQPAPLVRAPDYSGQGFPGQNYSGQGFPTQDYSAPNSYSGPYAGSNPFPNSSSSAFPNPAGQGFVPSATHGSATQPGWNQSTPNPMRSSSPVSGAGMANSSPAANQPAFSTADRPLQWQAPRR